MTRTKNEYFLGSSYTKAEAFEIIKSFAIRKLEELIKVSTIIILIIAVIALCNGQRLEKEADEILARCEQTLSYSRSLSVEEEMWNRINSLEVPEHLLQSELPQQETFKIMVEYEPTEEERNFAYCLAFGEAGVESDLGQTLVINVAINNMKEKGYENLIEEFTKEGRYSSVIDGKVYNCGEVVTINDIPQSVKNAVDAAFEYDYSEEMLKQEAEKLGITNPRYWEDGALYFYNPEFCSDFQNKLRENVKVKFECGDHMFYRYWDE